MYELRYRLTIKIIWYFGLKSTVFMINHTVVHFISLTDGVTFLRLSPLLLAGQQSHSVVSGYLSKSGSSLISPQLEYSRGEEEEGRKFGSVVLHSETKFSSVQSPK